MNRETQGVPLHTIIQYHLGGVRRFRATGSGTVYGPSALNHILRANKYISGSRYVAKTWNKDAAVRYDYSKSSDYMGDRNWIGTQCLAKSISSSGSDQSRMTFGRSNTEAKRGENILYAIRALGDKLSDMQQEGENLSYTVDSQYRAAGGRVVSVTSHGITLGYKIPFNEEKLAEFQEKQRLEAENDEAVAALINSSATQYEDSANKIQNAAEKNKQAAADILETEKIRQQTSTSRSLRYVGVGAICAAVLVTAIVIVKKIRG